MRQEAGICLPMLTEIRRRKLLSQVELAARAGLGKNTVLRLENGSGAQYGTVRKLAEALGVEPRDLMTPSDGAVMDDESRDSPGEATATVEQADAAFEQGLSRLSATLRSQHPELFDASGELRRDVALRLLARRVQGSTMLSRAALLALTGGSDGRPPDAP